MFPQRFWHNLAIITKPTYAHTASKTWNYMEIMTKSTYAHTARKTGSLLASRVPA